MKKILIKLSAFKYRWLLRPVLFLSQPDWAHNWFVHLGELLGKSGIIKTVLAGLWRVKNPALAQTIHGIHFANPIGLAAGFDYEARLTDILPAMGFGFGTIGTITNKPYGGNPSPMLGRLIKSKSLMVNKGFKNPGIHAILKKMNGRNFAIPVGISIGKTNTPEPMTQAQAIDDIVSAFQATEAASAPFGYYELNISCPNLYGQVEFYSAPRLAELLQAVSDLSLSKPIFIKMPIDKTDAETLAMLKIISAHPVRGVIFGNVQKNRQDPSLLPEEVAKFPSGSFSGKPTEQRANELIRLAFKHYGSKLAIIGCGGVFNAIDAYKKIRLGASLIELITGLIFVGPQLAGQINYGLLELLRRDGFSHISQAIGADILTGA